MMLEGFSPRTSWPYGGRYDPLCAAGAFGYTPVEPGLQVWTPRQIKAIDEAVWRLCQLEVEKEDLPRTSVSRWCGCIVDSSARVE